MGANFEIEIAARGIIQISELMSVAAALGCGCVLKSISSYSNWFHEKSSKRAVSSTEDIAEVIEGGGIVHADLSVGRRRGGAIYSKENGYITHSLWFDTELFPALDCNELDEASSGMCRALAGAVLELTVEFDFAALGPELFLAGDEMDTLIKGSSNVLIWLISDEMRVGEIPGFELAGRSGSKLIFAKKPCQEKK